MQWKDDVSVHSITEDTVYVHNLIYFSSDLIWYCGKFVILPN